MSSVDICGSQVRSRYFPSSFASAVTAAASTRNSPPGVTRRNRFRPGLVEITPRNSARRVGESRSESSIIAASRSTRFARVAASRSAASGLWHFLQNLRVAGLLESAVPGLAIFGVSLARFRWMSVDCGRVLSAASV